MDGAALKPMDLSGREAGWPLRWEVDGPERRRPEGRRTGTRVGGQLALTFVLVLTLFAVAGCSGTETAVRETPRPLAVEQVPAPASDMSEAARAGEELFNANCSACHGLGAVGTTLGPPLVHRVYHPGHHPDFSIRSAVAQGVPQHHWPFGDMAPVQGIKAQDVEKLICYIREAQRVEGIFEGDDFGTVC